MFCFAARMLVTSSILMQTPSRKNFLFNLFINSLATLRAVSSIQF
jgi:hypothetical protein